MLEVEPGRYYSLQFVDMYTFNFAFVGSRTSGNGPGKFLLAGPHWNGEKPDGIKAVIRSDADFDFVQYRTQLFNPGDIENVKKIQAAYKVEPLSRFLGKPAPKMRLASDVGTQSSLERITYSIAVERLRLFTRPGPIASFRGNAALQSLLE